MGRRIQGGAEWQTERDMFEYSQFGYYGVTDERHYGAGNWSYWQGGTISNGWAYGDTSIYGQNIQALPEYYAKADVYIDSMPSSDGSTFDAFFSMSGTSNSVTGNVYMPKIYNNGGTLYLRVEINNGAIVEDPINLGVPVNTWFRFEVHFNSRPADGSEVLEFKVNGTTVYSRSDLTFAYKQPYVQSSSPANIISGMKTSYIYNGTGSTQDFKTFFDNIAINDHTGSQNNSWVGEEYVVIFGTTNNNTNQIPYNQSAFITRTTAGDSYYKLAVSGIQSYDEVKAIMPIVMARETESGTSAFSVAVKSPSSNSMNYSTAWEEAGSHVSSVDEKFLQPAVNYPSLVAIGGNINDTWIGVRTNNSVDVRISAIMGTVAYTPGESPPGGMLAMF